VSGIIIVSLKTPSKYRKIKLFKNKNKKVLKNYMHAYHKDYL